MNFSKFAKFNYPIDEWQLLPFSRWLWREIEPAVYAFFCFVGQVTLDFRVMFGYLLKGKLSLKHLAEEASFIGVDALPVGLILTMFSGMVISLQVAKELVNQGAGNYVGALVAVSTLREFAPIMTGFAVIALNGSAYAAQLGSMKVQNQIDALKVMHVDPIRYLVLPKTLAAVLMLPLMTLLTAFAGIIGGMIVSYFIGDLNYSKFIESVWQFTKVSDVLGAMLKSGVFGALIMVISTTFGLSAEGSAKSVGEKTQQAVVWSFIAIAVADYFLSFMLF